MGTLPFTQITYLLVFNLVVNCSPRTRPARSPLDEYSLPSQKSSYTYYTPLQQQDYNPAQFNPLPAGSFSQRPNYQHQQQPTYGPSPMPQIARLYLAAPPGQRPGCAKDGATYCEYIDYYPGELILKLYRERKVDLGSLLVNEKPVYNSENAYGQPGVNYSPGVANYPTEKYASYERTRYSYNDVAIVNFNATTNEDYVAQVAGSRDKRQSGGFGTTLCNQRTSSKIIQAAMDTNGLWKYVVNLPQPVVRQSINFWECAKPNEPCRSDLCSPPSNVKTGCQQRTRQVRLLSLHESGSILSYDTYQLPSACLCTFSIG